MDKVWKHVNLLSLSLSLSSLYLPLSLYLSLSPSLPSLSRSLSRSLSLSLSPSLPLSPSPLSLSLSLSIQRCCNYDEFTPSSRLVAMQFRCICHVQLCPFFQILEPGICRSTRSLLAFHLTLNNSLFHAAFSNFLITGIDSQDKKRTSCVVWVHPRWSMSAILMSYTRGLSGVVR